MGSKAQEEKPLRGEGLQPLIRGFITALALSLHAVCSLTLLLYPSCLPAPSTQEISKPRVREEAAHRLLGPHPNFSDFLSPRAFPGALWAAGSLAWPGGPYPKSHPNMA